MNDAPLSTSVIEFAGELTAIADGRPLPEIAADGIFGIGMLIGADMPRAAASLAWTLQKFDPDRTADNGWPWSI